MHSHQPPECSGIFQASGQSVLSERSLQHLWQLHEQGQFQSVLAASLEALRLAQQSIPPDFQGTIPWLHLDNRAYLRLIHITVLAHSALGEHLQAIALIDYVLRINPPDNQGMRYLLASELLSAQQYDRAQSLLIEQIPEQPSQAYELAFLYVRQANWLQATTALRQAWQATPQIGRRIEKAFTQPSNRSAETERGDAAAHIQRWKSHSQASQFFLWLLHHPQFQTEIDSAKCIRQALKANPSWLQRCQLLGQQFMAKRRIHDASSQAFLHHGSQAASAALPWGSSAAGL